MSWASCRTPTRPWPRPLPPPSPGRLSPGPGSCWAATASAWTTRPPGSSPTPRRSTPTKAPTRCRTSSSARPSPASVPSSDGEQGDHRMTATAAAPGLENVLYEAKGAIAYVTVNRPKVLNALNTRTWADLRAAFEQAREDPAVQGVILTGAGDKAFIAGADISEFAHVTAVEAEESSSFGQEVLNLIENLGKPVIAAVNGFAL